MHAKALAIGKVLLRLFVTGALLFTFVEGVVMRWTL
jgi:hypothetical protein